MLSPCREAAWERLRSKSLLRRYGVFNTYIVIDNHGYDGNHINGIIDLTDKGIGVKQSFL